MSQSQYFPNVGISLPFISG